MINKWIFRYFPNLSLVSFRNNKTEFLDWTSWVSWISGHRAPDILKVWECITNTKRFNDSSYTEHWHHLFQPCISSQHYSNTKTRFADRVHDRWRREVFSEHPNHGKRTVLKKKNKPKYWVLWGNSPANPTFGNFTADTSA